jgi:putative phage-type endonuclease
VTPPGTIGYARKVCDTDGLSRPEWLALRRAGIGGSDAAAVCGLDPYRSPFELWLDKTGLFSDDAGAGEAADWGNLLEPVIADEVGRREALQVIHLGWMLGHPDHHFMLADLDRVFIDPDDVTAVLEIKTTSPFRADEWRDRIPIPVMCQTQHYLAVTGLPYALVAVLIGGQRLVTHRVERDDDLIGTLIDQETAFWRLVTDREPPEPDGSKATTDLLGRLYDVDPDAVTVVDRSEVEPTLAALRFARERQDMAEADRREAENRIKVLMGGAALLADGDGQPIARWPEVRSQRLDVERLRTDHPALATEYATTTTSRRFTVVKR